MAEKVKWKRLQARIGIRPVILNRSSAADAISGLPAAFYYLLSREEYENETTVSDPLRAAPRKLPKWLTGFTRRRITGVPSEYLLLP